MAAALTMDLRVRVMTDVDAGLSPEKAAVKYSVTARTIYHWKALRRETGTLEPRDGKTGPKPKLEEHREQILAAVRDDCGITLSDLKTKLQLPACVATLWNALQAWGIVLKKKVLRASEQQRPDVVEKRCWWDILMKRHAVDRYVFLDEMGANTKMTRLYGWGPKSERVVASVPHGHWKSTTFLGALRTTGLTAPLVIDGALTGELFLAYVQQQLLPTLSPGDIVVLDNLSSHKHAGVRESIEAAGCTLAYLPPYSPDLNPIELLFSKLKSLLRKHAERTVDSLWTRIGKLVTEFSPDECRNYLKHCGYAVN